MIAAVLPRERTAPSASPTPNGNAMTSVSRASRTLCRVASRSNGSRQATAYHRAVSPVDTSRLLLTDRRAITAIGSSDQVTYTYVSRRRGHRRAPAIG
jgi:hypothetical protein